MYSLPSPSLCLPEKLSEIHRVPLTSYFTPFRLSRKKILPVGWLACYNLLPAINQRGVNESSVIKAIEAKSTLHSTKVQLCGSDGILRSHDLRKSKPCQWTQPHPLPETPSWGSSLTLGSRVFTLASVLLPPNRLWADVCSANIWADLRN